MKKDSAYCLKFHDKGNIVKLKNGCQLTDCESVIKTKKDTETYKFLSNFNTSVNNIAEYYNLRWKVETFFQYFKSRMETNSLKSSSFDNCKQEVYSKIYGYLIARIVERIALNSVCNKNTTIKNRHIIKKYCKNEKIVNFNALLSNVYSNIAKILQKETFVDIFKSMCKSTLKGLIDFRKKTSKRLRKKEKKKKGKKPSLLTFCKSLGNETNNLVTRIFRWIISSPTVVSDT